MPSPLRGTLPHLSRISVAGLFTVAVAVVPTNASARNGVEVVPSFDVVSAPVLRAKPPARVLPVAHYRLTGRFGASSYHWSSMHTGLDFAAAYGADIRAVESGVVTAAEYDGSYGNKTVITLADGTEVWYCHQESLDVSVGERVRAGQVIGSVGMTGNTTGPHLHLEVRPGGGDPVHPGEWLAARNLPV